MMLRGILYIIMISCLVLAGYFLGRGHGVREGHDTFAYDRANLPWRIDIPSRDENMTPLTIHVFPYELNNGFLVRVIKESPTQIITNEEVIQSPTDEDYNIKVDLQTGKFDIRPIGRRYQWNLK